MMPAATMRTLRAAPTGLGSSPLKSALLLATIALGVAALISALSISTALNRLMEPAGRPDPYHRRRGAAQPHDGGDAEPVPADRAGARLRRIEADHRRQVPAMVGRHGGCGIGGRSRPEPVPVGAARRTSDGGLPGRGGDRPDRSGGHAAGVAAAIGMGGLWGRCRSSPPWMRRSPKGSATHETAGDPRTSCWPTTGSCARACGRS